jgi:hypothetical protein
MIESTMIKDDQEQLHITDPDVGLTIANLKGIPTRDQLMEMLGSEVLEVTFLKLDGDERKMPCTLIASYLPPAKKDDPLSQKKVRQVSDKVCAVWATESKGFRSFRYDRVTNVKVLDKDTAKQLT